MSHSNMRDTGKKSVNHPVSTGHEGTASTGSLNIILKCRRCQHQGDI